MHNNSVVLQNSKQLSSYLDKGHQLKFCFRKYISGITGLSTFNIIISEVQGQCHLPASDNVCVHCLQLKEEKTLSVQVQGTKISTASQKNAPKELGWVLGIKTICPSVDVGKDLEANGQLLHTVSMQA